MYPGMYNVPSFTLARTVGGLMNWYWRVRLGKDDTPLIVLASVSDLHPRRFFYCIILFLLTAATGFHLGGRVFEHCEFDIAEHPGASLMRI